MTPNIKPISPLVQPTTVASSANASTRQVPPSDDNFSIGHSDNWICPASAKSIRTTNPIRAIVDPIVASSIKSGTERKDGKDMISLALGDPTTNGNLPSCQVAIEAIMKKLASPGSCHAAGYTNACGTPEARESIAIYHSFTNENIMSKVESDDVIVTNGCSGALELALTALLDPGTILLVPSPGFPLYQVIAESHGAQAVHYNLLPNKQWECDLDHMEHLICQYTPGVVRGVVVNNPSNPTGACFSQDHLKHIVRLARRYRLPIVADEVYGDLTFGDNIFHPLSQIAAEEGHSVPIITASGLGKQYLLPGWRVGWLVFHDSHNGALQEVKAGAKRLAQVILGASHLTQCAIPACLTPQTEKERESILQFKTNLKCQLEHQAMFFCNALQNKTFQRCCPPGLLTVLQPQGAMYTMVQVDLSKFDNNDDLIQDDISFTKCLLQEENVFVLPGQAFGIHVHDAPYYYLTTTKGDKEKKMNNNNNATNTCVFRVVFCAPEDTLEEAANRIANFCHRHQKASGM